jgi:hypothetical protein
LGLTSNSLTGYGSGVAESFRVGFRLGTKDDAEEDKKGVMMARKAECDATLGESTFLLAVIEKRFHEQPPVGKG